MEHLRIPSEDISIVIQGPVYGNQGKREGWTSKTIKSVRLQMPGSEIILSTWKGQSAEDLGADKIVYSNDPGPDGEFTYGHLRKKTLMPLNINRQLISTQEGLAQCSRRYVIKMRSDMVIRNIRFLNYYKKYGNHRILMPNSHVPSDSYGKSFCINDFFQFAEKEKMDELWNIPLYDSGFLQREGIYIPSLPPEEYIMLHFLKKHLPYSLKDMFYLKENVILQDFERILSKHFIIVPFAKSGLECLKYKRKNSFKEVYIKHTDYSFYDWKYFYDKYERGICSISLFSHYTSVMSEKFVYILRRMTGKAANNGACDEKSNRG